MSPEVSVLMPAYNAGPYIGDAIRSCLTQTFEDFELIIVDDASTDETARVAQGFTDSRVRFARNSTNRGESHTRNSALDLAAGTWITLLDADDLWDRSRLEVLHSMGAQSGDRSVVYDRIESFVVDRRGRYRTLAPNAGRRGGHGDVEVTHLDPIEFVRQGKGGQPMFSRALASETGARHPSGVRVGGDTAFQIQLLNAEAVEVRRVALGLYRYRVHPGTPTGSKDRLGELRRAYDFLLMECDLRSEMREAVEHRVALLERELAFSSLRESIIGADWERIVKIVKADPSLVPLFAMRAFRSVAYRARLRAWGSEGRG